MPSTVHTERRRKFLEVCAAHLSDFELAFRALQAGSVAKSALEGQPTAVIISDPQSTRRILIEGDSSAPEVTPEAEADASRFIEVPPWAVRNLRRLCVSTHASLITEWQLYLDRCFRDAILELLGTGGVPRTRRLPRMEVDVTEISWKDLDSARKTFAEHLAERFSRKQYDAKIKALKELYVVVPGNASTRRATKKHVDVRNLFQHRTGNLRKSDLKRFGYKPIPLIGENGQPKTFGRGVQLTLSSHDVRDLVEVARRHSLDFEQLKPRKRSQGNETGVLHPGGLSTNVSAGENGHRRDLR